MGYIKEDLSRNVHYQQIQNFLGSVFKYKFDVAFNWTTKFVHTVYSQWENRNLNQLKVACVGFNESMEGGQI